MIGGLDLFFGIFVAGQLVISTLRSGSRFIKTRTASNSRLPGPFILPPDENETSRLYDIANAFREGVELGLLRENYTSINEVTVSLSKICDGEDGKDAVEPYYLSLRPVRQLVPTEGSGDEGVDGKSNTTESRGMVLIDYSVSQPGISTPSRDFTTHSDLQSTPASSIRAYAANQFAGLRSMFGISEAAFRRSLVESGPYVSFQSNSKGAARIGGIFVSCIWHDRIQKHPHNN
jgi:hypothetical protein